MSKFCPVFGASPPVRSRAYALPKNAMLWRFYLRISATARVILGTLAFESRYRHSNKVKVLSDTFVSLRTFIWCRQWDSNPHARKDNRFWVCLVCQFRHAGGNISYYTTILSINQVLFLSDVSLYFPTDASLYKKLIDFAAGTGYNKEKTKELWLWLN